MKTAARIAILGALSRRWLDSKFRFRRLAVKRLVQKSGFAPAAAQAMLDSLFNELTAPKLKLLVRIEAGSLKKLDSARGPQRITHVLSGNIPNPGVQSVIHGLLVRSENSIKPSSRDEGIVDLYLASLRACDRKLAASCRLLKASDRAGLQRAIGASDLVIAYGSDESVAAVKAMTGSRTKFVGYGHRVSFSIITRGAQTPAVARATALDVWMMDRRGCLSPALIFVEDTEKTGDFCYRVLVELERLEKREGKTRPDMTRAMAIRSAHHEAKLDGGTLVRTKKGRYFIRVCELKRRGWVETAGADFRPFQRISEVCGILRRFSPVLQACALECPPKERAAITRRFGALGFNRICRAGALQFPPITWPHDGRPNFSDWLTGVNGKISR